MSSNENVGVPNGLPAKRLLLPPSFNAALHLMAVGKA